MGSNNNYNDDSNKKMPKLSLTSTSQGSARHHTPCQEHKPGPIAHQLTREAPGRDTSSSTSDDQTLKTAFHVLAYKGRDRVRIVEARAGALFAFHLST
eukprot:3512864-Amphidinium_carterae.1